MLRIPLDRLPEADSERHAILRHYFCDKDALAARTSNAWELTMFWPSGADRHVDPSLREGLRWWGDGIDHGSMSSAARRDGRILTCLYDSLTLESWSHWWASRGNKPISSLLVLHVDDHRDLGSPRLFIDRSDLCDAITGSPVSIADPASVSAAIASGAVGMGSFLTPFLHTFPNAEVRHLCQPPKAVTTSDFLVQLTTERDTLIDPTKYRPAIELKCWPRTAGPGTYRITPNLSDWLQGVPEVPTLLHIDMDYFNNRYDGDTDWRKREQVLDPSLTDIKQRIEALCDTLRSSGILSQIEDVVVAYSPGFFPAEFWGDADAILRRNLMELYAN